MAARDTELFGPPQPRFTARLRWGRIAPRKLRLVADLIRGKSYSEASAILRHQPRRGAYFALKLLKSAFDNASDEIRRRRMDIDPEELVVGEVRVDGGLMLKRIRPGTRRPMMVRKRTSHMVITLTPAPAGKEPQQARRSRSAPPKGPQAAAPNEASGTPAAGASGTPPAESAPKKKATETQGGN